MKKTTMLKHVQVIDSSLVELYQEILTLQEELKYAQKVLRKVARSNQAKELGREYCASLLKFPKT